MQAGSCGALCSGYRSPPSHAGACRTAGLVCETLGFQGYPTGQLLSWRRCEAFTAASRKLIQHLVLADPCLGGPGALSRGALLARHLGWSGWALLCADRQDVGCRRAAVPLRWMSAIVDIRGQLFIVVLKLGRCHCHALGRVLRRFTSRGAFCLGGC